MHAGDKRRSVTYPARRPVLDQHRCASYSSVAPDYVDLLANTTGHPFRPEDCYYASDPWSPCHTRSLDVIISSNEETLAKPAVQSIITAFAQC